MEPTSVRGPVLCLDKPFGWSPVETLRAARRGLPGYTDAVLGYAGRLDPMAEGVLLALVDDENKRAAGYLGLNKRYRVDVLFGVTTDTFDALGLVQSYAPNAGVDASALRAGCANIVGTFVQPYPPFSSVRVRGRPMFHWARKGAMNADEVPARARTVTACELLALVEIDGAALFERVAAGVGRVRGDFRQAAIMDAWRAALGTPSGRTSHALATLDVRCSTGTYMRSLAHQLGRALGPGAIALRIVRTEAGPFTLNDAIKLEDHWREESGR